MDMTGAVRQLASLRDTLRSGTADPSLVPISLEVEPRVWIPPATEPRVRLRSADSQNATGEVDLVIEARTTDGESLVRREIRASRSSLARGEVSVADIDWSALRTRMAHCAPRQVCKFRSIRKKVQLRGHARACNHRRNTCTTRHF